MNRCVDCFYFDYDELWDGEEEIQLFMCGKQHWDHISFNADPCEDFVDDKTIKEKENTND